MKWAVIGGGPSGIGAVGKLIDAGQQVIWIDPNFENIGRMGKYYRGVPANTPNESLWNALTNCQSFEIAKYYANKVKNNEVTLRDLEPSECSQLGYLCDALEHASSTLQSNNLVTVIQGTVTSIFLKDSWNIDISLPDDVYTIQREADCILLAHGASPIFPPNRPPSPSHKVDHMVNPVSVQKILDLHPEFLSQPWAVVGSSHSAMLVIKNLIEAGVQQIVNYYRSDFIFEELTDEGWYRNRGSGLKGPVGDWVRNELQNYSNITRVRLLNDTELLFVAPQYETRIVYCCGYARDDNAISIKLPLRSTDQTELDTQQGHRLTTEDLNRYNKWTGEIHPKSRLYGVGIAFPQCYQHEDGTVELWVGFRRSMTQVDSILRELSLITD